jgi:hypothetical protein
VAKVKVYNTELDIISDDRARNILNPSNNYHRHYNVYVVATSKAEGFNLIQHFLGDTWLRESSLIVAKHKEAEALAQAGLLSNEHTVIVTTDERGAHPVVRFTLDEDGAQAIGQIKTTGDFREPVFHPAMAQYASPGSVAVGLQEAYFKYRSGDGTMWCSTIGGFLSDDQMQQLIDRGVVEIIRAGTGYWCVEPKR